MGPRRCPRQCRERSPRGTAWVRVGPRRCPRHAVSASVRGPGPHVGPRGSASVLGGRVGPRESAWVRVSVRVSAGTGASRGSASVAAWVRVGPRQCPPQAGTGAPRGSAWVRVSARVGAGPNIGARVRPRVSAAVSAQCPGQCRAPSALVVGPRQCPCECVGPGPRVGLRGSGPRQCPLGGRPWGPACVHVGPRGSASVSASVRGGKTRGADATHTHFATTFCGKNIGPEFDTGTRQALCTATVPPKRL